VAPNVTWALVGQLKTETGETTVTVVESNVAVSSTEVAFMVTAGGLGTVEGAVYNPEVLTVPQEAPLQPVPEIVQVTLESAAFWTDAVNCSVEPMLTDGAAGEIVMITAAMTVTVAVADLEESAMDVAMTLTVAGLGTLAGAV
jgi:hypothetical protein